MRLISACLFILIFFLSSCAVNRDIPDASDPSKFILDAGINQRAVLKLKQASIIHNDTGIIWKTMGTGFLISNNGCFLITYHQYTKVMREKGQISVPLYGKVALLGILSEHDLTLLKIEEKEETPFLPIASHPYRVRPQEHMLLMPAFRPHRVFLADDPTEGPVLVKNTVTGGSKIFWVYRLVGDVRPGDSGSPLINQHGEAIGIAIASGGGGVSAIPISREFLRQNLPNFSQCE